MHIYFRFKMPRTRIIALLLAFSTTSRVDSTATNLDVTNLTQRLNTESIPRLSTILSNLRYLMLLRFRSERSLLKRFNAIRVLQVSWWSNDASYLLYILCFALIYLNKLLSPDRFSRLRQYSLDSINFSRYAEPDINQRLFPPCFTIWLLNPFVFLAW